MQPEERADAQAPGHPAGQAPARGETPQGTGTAPAGQEPAEPFDPDRAQALIAKLREEARAATRELTTFRDRQKEAEDAQLSETERLRKRLAAMEAQEATRQRDVAERVLSYEIQLQAARLGIVDPDAALKLLDHSLITYDPDGRPAGVDKALAVLLKEKPYLVAAPTNGQTAPPAGAAPTNPATRSAGAAGTRRYSQADLADRDNYVRNREDIVRAYREGRIDLD